MSELHFDLQKTRCPRCAGDLVLRVRLEESGLDVRLTADTACVACGTAPWADSDERLLVFRPGQASFGAPSNLEDSAARLLAAQARNDQLLRRVEGLTQDLAAAKRQIERAEDAGRQRQGEVIASLKGEVSRLEGALAEARVELRRADEATHGTVAEGHRPIEVE